MDVTILGHGSLMSGRGLSFSGTFEVHRACIVALAGCQRGFAKLSMYGNRFATDLAIQQFPLAGRIVPLPNGTHGADGTIETLALTVSLDDSYRLIKREGYQPEAAQKLARIAQDRGYGLADFLWKLDTEAEHDVVTYRRCLFELTDYTSPHYIPHPVPIDAYETALIFLAPGAEGTGSDGVISIRQQTGMNTVMSPGETWQHKPNEEQLAYFLSCLLGGVHGVKIHDLLPHRGDDPQLISVLTHRLHEEIDPERRQFLETIGFAAERYGQAFGEPEQLLKRSGLHDFLAGDLSTRPE